jgi:phosphoribosylglycinamide formyltransferase-1
MKNAAADTGAARRRIAILLSGRGSNFEAIADAVRDGAIPDAEIVAVISDVPDAPGLEKARGRGLPALALDRSAYASRAAFESDLSAELDRARAELVCLAGFMRILSAGFIAPRRGRILNIHPSLLPDFPGLEPQRRALEAGATQSGCTVHLVDEGTDTGPVVLRRPVPVLPNDSVQSLSARILVEEHRAYPEAIARVLSTLPPRP